MHLFKIFSQFYRLQYECICSDHIKVRLGLVVRVRDVYTKLRWANDAVHLQPSKAFQMISATTTSKVLPGRADSTQTTQPNAMQPIY